MWIRCSGSGGSKPSNPILFENGTFAEGLGYSEIAWSSSYTIETRYYIDSDGFHVQSNNGNRSECFYVGGFDLSEYAGKNLYFNYACGSDAQQLKAFLITASSKRPIFGLATIYDSGWNYMYGMGISAVNIPQYCTTNSDFYQGNNGSSGKLLTISKIWIGD